MWCVFISEQTATCATYSINRLVFITQMKSVYSAVRTGSLNKAVCSSSLKGYTAFGVVLSVSDRPVATCTPDGHLLRVLQQMLY